MQGEYSSDGDIVGYDRNNGVRILLGSNQPYIPIGRKYFLVLGTGGDFNEDPHSVTEVIMVSADSDIYTNNDRGILIESNEEEALLHYQGSTIKMVCAYPVVEEMCFEDSVNAILDFINF